MKKLKRYIKPTTEIITINQENLLQGMSPYKAKSGHNVIYGSDDTETTWGPGTSSSDRVISNEGGEETLDGAKVNPWGSWDEE